MTLDRYGIVHDWCLHCNESRAHELDGIKLTVTCNVCRHREDVAPEYAARHLKEES